tara:strand:+ start:771 stop:1901 length:1131 start_codon:yes stop_codon:yes gene_type:complete
MNKPILSKSRRLKKTIFTDRLEEQGLSAYTVYAQTLLPSGFKDSLEDDYFHLTGNGVQIFDVAGQVVIRFTGKDSKKLVQLMTPRDLSNAIFGKCYYCPFVNEQGKMLNDPVVLKLKEGEWLVSIADSAVDLFAQGLAIGMNLDVKIERTSYQIMTVQGKNGLELCRRVFGDKILNQKFYNYDYFDYNGSSFLVGHLGWTKQKQGREIWVSPDQHKEGLDLYDHFFDIGKDLNIKPGYPNLIERIEGGLLSMGNDMDSFDTPLECGLEKFINLDSEAEFLGKDILRKQKEEGIHKKLMGVKIKNLKKIEVDVGINIYVNDQNIGELRSAVYSPNPKHLSVIGIAMIKKGYFDVGQEFDITVDEKNYKGEVCALPFI